MSKSRQQEHESADHIDSTIRNQQQRTRVLRSHSPFYFVQVPSHLDGNIHSQGVSSTFSNLWKDSYGHT